MFKKDRKSIIIMCLTILILVNTFLFFNFNGFSNEDTKPLYDKNGIYYHNFDLSKLKLENDKFYYEDDNYYSILGVDVSTFQKEVDYKVLKDEGIEFVYIRAGYRGSSSGNLFIDEMMETHYSNAKKEGLLIGFYFYSQAINVDEAIEEAKFLLDITKEYETDLPYCFDGEKSMNQLARTNFIIPEIKEDVMHTFSNTIIENGNDVIIYANKEYINKNYNIKELVSYKLWYAQYALKPDYLYPFYIWQYTNTGEINGIKGNADLNIMFISKD